MSVGMFEKDVIRLVDQVDKRKLTVDQALRRMCMLVERTMLGIRDDGPSDDMPANRETIKGVIP